MTDTAFSLARTARTLALGLLLSALALPAPAAERDPAEILALQIDMAGRQRMLSQRLVASACFLSLGIQHDTQALALTEVSEIFPTTLNRLIRGDTLLNLPATTDPQVRWALQGARMVWGQVEPRVKAVLTGDASPEALRDLAEHEPALLTASQGVVAALTANLAISPNQATRLRAVDMAGRQRMLSQAIIMEACLLSRAEALGLDTTTHHAAITARTDLFELSMSMLRVGDDDAGVAPPPDIQTEEALDRSLLIWTDMRELLDPALEGQALSLDTLDDLAVAYETLLQELEDIVWMTASG